MLTFQDKKECLKDNFPDAEIIILDDKAVVGRHELSAQLLRLVFKRRFDFVVLSSLDILTLAASLFLSRCPIFLYNRWFEWYQIRLRTLRDIMRGVKSADKNRRKINRSLKDIVKSLGRISVVLIEVSGKSMECPILIEDNGYTDIAHVLTAVRRAREIFSNPDITILTFEARKHYFEDAFTQVKKIVIVGPTVSRYGLAAEMLRIRKDKFKYIVLTTLDVSPIIIAFSFFKAKILLYNKWHQWWGLRIKNGWDYLKNVLAFIVSIPILIYLIISATFILCGTKLRLVLMNLRVNYKDKERIDVKE